MFYSVVSVLLWLVSESFFHRWLEDNISWTFALDVNCEVHPVWVSWPSHCEHICILTTSALIISQQQQKLVTIHPHVHFQKSIFLKVETFAIGEKKNIFFLALCGLIIMKVDSLSNLLGVGEVKMPSNALWSTDFGLHWKLWVSLCSHPIRCCFINEPSGESQSSGVDRHHAEHTGYYQRTKKQRD